MIEDVGINNKFAIFILHCFGLFTLIYVPRQISPIIMLIIVMVLIKISDQNLKLSVNFLAPFFLMLIIGLLIGLDKPMWDQLRDLGFGILFISSVYLGLISFDQLGKQGYLSFIMVLAFAVITETLKLFSVTTFSLVEIRQQTSGIYEVFIILIILSIYKQEFIPKRFSGLPLLVLIVSLPVAILTQSRTVLAQVIIFFLFKYVYERKNRLRAIMISSGAILIIYSAVVIMGRTSDPYTFMGKLARIDSEIIPVSSDLSGININTDWRAAESLLALNQITNSSPVHILLGSGVGSRITLGFEMPLGDSILDTIPITHNGYIYILLKYGIVGLMLFAYLMYSILRVLGRIKISSPNKYLVGVSCIGIIMVSQIFSGGIVQNSQLLLVVLLSGILRDCQNILKRPISKNS